MSEKEYIVVVHKDVNLEEVDAEIAASTGSGPIPNRSVDVANPRTGSKRMTHWLLTDDEAVELEKDPRILSVELPPEQRTDISLIKFATQNLDFTKVNASTIEGYANWGLARCSSATNNYLDNPNPTPNRYEYSITGKGVDIVVQDSGIQADHPEFNDFNGSSRVQQIDWYAESGLAGAQPAGFYTDYDGHGTHCASVAAGKIYGWAKEANIYAQKLAGLEGPTDPNSGMPIADCFDAIRLWHNAKPIDPDTGFKRPTIVNMSWGYATVTGEDVTGGEHYDLAFNSMLTYTPGLGTSGYDDDLGLWTRTGLPPKLFENGTLRSLPARVASVDAEIDDLIAAGVHVVIAAGNDYTVTHNPAASPDPYWNFATFPSLGNYYYMRGSSPRSTGTDDAFVVGSMDTTTFGLEDKIAQYSTKGQQVNILAPGTNIIAATSSTSIYTTANYPDNANFNIANISGTSFAAPQVVGVGALHLQSKPWLTPTELVQLLYNESQAIMYDRSVSTPVDYNQYSNLALYGSANRILFSKYSQQPGSLTGSLTITNINYGT
jgi:subtilisin family serine protease